MGKGYRIIQKTPNYLGSWNTNFKMLFIMFETWFVIREVYWHEISFSWLWTKDHEIKVFKLLKGWNFQMSHQKKCFRDASPTSWTWKFWVELICLCVISVQIVAFPAREHKVSSCRGTFVSSTASNGSKISPLLSKAIVMRQRKICSETQ